MNASSMKRKLLELIVLVDGTPLKKSVLVKNGHRQINAKRKTNGITYWEKMGYNKYAHLTKKKYEEKYPGKKINIKYLDRTI